MTSRSVKIIIIYFLSLSHVSAPVVCSETLAQSFTDLTMS